MIYRKFSHSNHGNVFYKFNEENVNVMLEYEFKESLIALCFKPLTSKVPNWSDAV